LGGLVGATPHMISASVMALARLLYEFAPVLTGLIPSLLPPVLLLLRSKAREVIKAVLGFVKVILSIKLCFVHWFTLLWLPLGLCPRLPQLHVDVVWEQERGSQSTRCARLCNSLATIVGVLGSTRVQHEPVPNRITVILVYLYEEYSFGKI